MGRKNTQSESGPTIQAIEISCQLMKVVRQMGRARLTEITDQVDVSKSTVYNHLSTLAEYGFVVKEDGRYKIGLKFMEYGNAALDDYGIRLAAREPLEKLAEQTGEVVQLVVEENGLCYYLIKEEGENAVETSSRVGGAHHQLYCTAFGKVILAHLADNRTKEIIDQIELRSLTANTITDQDELFRELDTIRERGYAIDREEMVSGLRCVAAPVLDSDGSLEGAISVAGPKGRLEGDYLEEQLPEEVQKTAHHIEVNVAGGVF